MRRRILASLAKSGYTAKDYVQDGLVAMWDGIENAGWGVHDPNATVWRDLIGGMNFTISNGYFNDTSFVQPDKNVCARSEFASKVLTAEWCLENINGNCVMGRPFAGSNIVLVFYGDGSRVQCHGISNLTLSKFDYSAKQLSCVYSQSGDPRSFFVAGKFSESIYYSNAWSPTGLTLGRVSYGGRADWHCIRFYNRTLTPEEIAANYAIDKARFNLPDAA